MPWELYLIENKPIAICFQVVLEFVIFLIATLLWLTWCSQHILTHNLSESKSLAFALPGYLIGWCCLMLTRLFGSRLKEKFCFSFYLASGIRFMFSALILFPEFSREWYSVAYGLISMLCFVNTIFHIVTHPNIERRPVRRLIGPDGTLRDDPAMEMMTVKQLENYRDIIRNYMETHNQASVIPPSVEVITVSLHGSKGVSQTSGSSYGEGTQMPGTPWLAGDHHGTRVGELRPDNAFLGPSSSGLNATRSDILTVTVSDITIRSKSPPQPPVGNIPANDVAEPGEAKAGSRERSVPPIPSIAELPPSYRLDNRERSKTPDRNIPSHIKFRGGATIIDVTPTPSSTPSLSRSTYDAAHATPLESNQLQKCPRRSDEREVSDLREFATPQNIEPLARGVSRFSKDQIFDVSESKTRSHPHHKPTKYTPHIIHRVTCPLHTRQK